MKIILTFLLACILTTGLAYGATPFYIIVPGGTASISDSLARAMRDSIPGAVVINAPGGDGLVGQNKFDQLPVESSAIMSSVSQELLKKDHKPLYDNVETLMSLVSYSMVIAVSEKGDIKSVKDLIDLSKKRKLFGGSIGLFNTMSIKTMDTALGVTTEVVNYKDRGMLNVDLSNNIIDYTIVAISNPSTPAAIQSKQIRIIATLDDTRSEQFPAVHTLTELGYHGAEGFGWTGISVHKSMSSQKKNELYDSISLFFETDAGKAYLASTNLSRYITPTPIITRRMQRETARFSN